MSKSKFVKYEDFSKLVDLSIFVSQLGVKDLIQIETIHYTEGGFEEVTLGEHYRVWYYSI